MAELDIISAEVFACKSNAPQIIWAKDMSPMFEANIIVKLITESGVECVGGVLIPTEHHYDHSVVCLLYTSPSPRDNKASRMPSSA